jgi:hypothetical protein
MYQGKFKPKYPQKYIGVVDEIYYRSSWELSIMLWCDSNKNVTKWSSEEIVVPYLCPTDNKVRRYFIDFRITINDEKTYLVELKPRKYTMPPEQKSKDKRKRKRYITEVLEYVKNQAKWNAADAYAKKCGASFQVWTEDTLEQLGIKIIGK